MAEYNTYEANEEPMHAPRRFKTAFIFFSSARHKEMKEELALEGKAEKVRSTERVCIRICFFLPVVAVEDRCVVGDDLWNGT